MDYQFSFPVISEYFVVLLRGLVTTIEFTVVCLVLGVFLSFIICLLRISRFRLLRLVSTVYVEFFRCTPVLVQLFWIFFCLPIIINVELGNTVSAIIALTLFMGAIGSETFRSAIQGIPRDQLDTGAALGLSSVQKIRYIVFPQSIRISIPTLLSNCVSLFKESALVSTVGMSDLMYVGQNVSNTTARPVEILTTVALLYFVVAFPLTRLVSLLERRLADRIGG